MVVTIFRKKLLRFCEKVNALLQFANHTCLLFIIVTYLLDSQVPDGCMVPLATKLTLQNSKELDGRSSTIYHIEYRSTC